MTGKTSPLRVGPQGTCNPVATLPSGAQLSIDCYLTNPTYGTVWFHAAYGTAGRGVEGWIYEGNVQPLDTWEWPEMCV
ncbi:hypothetical protein CF166_34845 [Amycolatopsis sp. KNN50.9b]|nr:hypothetical protein CF166_34845 [Amycolatopsis sp. KNN50.9b]